MNPIITIPKGETPVKTQFALEQRVEIIVQQFNSNHLNARVEYFGRGARIVGGNGQKVRVVVV